MGIVCLAGIFAVFLLLAWTLCRAAGWEKEREDLEQEQYLNCLLYTSPSPRD